MKRLLLATIVASLPFIAVAQNPVPDLIIHHGRAYTPDPAHRWAEAVAIRGNRIVAVGTNAEITALAGDTTRRIDAGGNLVVPGFNDAHTHQGPSPDISMRLDNYPTWALLSAALANAAEETFADTWIFGTIGPALLADPNLTAEALDKASGHRKMLFSSRTGHGKILSAAAMHELRIRDSTADPIGGWYERDASHHLTGKMFEYAGWSAERALADSVSDAEAIEQLKQYSDEALRYGITSIQNMSMLPLKRYEKIERHGPAAIRVRIIRFPMTDNGRVTEGSDLPATDRERPLSIISGTKWILDGTPVEQGAALRRPYPGGGENLGKLNFPPDEIKAILKEGIRLKGTDAPARCRRPHCSGGIRCHAG